MLFIKKFNKFVTLYSFLENITSFGHEKSFQNLDLKICYYLLVVITKQ